MQMVKYSKVDKNCRDRRIGASEQFKKKTMKDVKETCKDLCRWQPTSQSLTFIQPSLTWPGYADNRRCSLAEQRCGKRAVALEWRSRYLEGNRQCAVLQQIAKHIFASPNRPFRRRWLDDPHGQLLVAGRWYISRIKIGFVLCNCQHTMNVQF